jgi:hypothetical protein
MYTYANDNYAYASIANQDTKQAYLDRMMHYLLKYSYCHKCRKYIDSYHIKDKFILDLKKEEINYLNEIDYLKKNNLHIETKVTDIIFKCHGEEDIVTLCYYYYHDRIHSDALGIVYLHKGIEDKLVFVRKNQNWCMSHTNFIAIRPFATTPYKSSIQIGEEKLRDLLY